MNKHHAVLFSSRPFQFDRSSGSHRIATFLREHAWDVEVVDFTAHLPLEQLKQLVEQRVHNKTIFFGFSSFFNFWNDTMKDLLAWCKTTYPNVKTIMGGVNIAYTTADPKYVDYWIDGYGELAILQLVKSLVGNDKVMFSNLGEKKIIKSLSLYPAWDLRSLKNILEPRDFVKPFEWLTIEFSRGCKFNCAYCNFPVLGVRHDNSRDAKDFEYEIKYNYDNFGVDRYTVTDETFNDREEKMIKFGDVVQSLDFDPYFTGYVRADLAIANPEHNELMARGNFGGHFYGIETFHHEAGKIIGKGMHPDKIKSGLVDIKNYMSKHTSLYRGTISLIVGLPKDTSQQWFETENWLNNNWTDESTIVFPLTLTDVADDNGEIDLTNSSKFSRDLMKYGIRRVSGYTKEELLRYRAAPEIRGWYPVEFEWEHDTMDVFEARKLSHNFSEHIKGKYRLNNFQLFIPDFNAQQKLKFNEIKDTLWTAHPANYDIIKKFLDEYITSKLNWAPSK